MIKLTKLITEGVEEFDDWIEYIKYESYAMPKEDIRQLIQKFGLQGKKYLDGKMVKLWDDKRFAWLEFDGDTLDYVDNIGEWLSNLNDYEYAEYVDPEIIYNSWVESSLNDLKENPGKVYHWTTEEKWEKIQQSGKMVGSSGSGLNNRGAYGIFTSINPEEYAIGSYGNICLELDLERFLKESGKPKLNLAWEPQVEEYLVREYLRSVLEIENDRDEIENDGGISPYTVVVNEVIPIQYVRQI